MRRCISRQWDHVVAAIGVGGIQPGRERVDVANHFVFRPFKTDAKVFSYYTWSQSSYLPYISPTSHLLQLSFLIFLLMAIVISLEKKPHSFLGFKIQIKKFELSSLSKFITAFLASTQTSVSCEVTIEIWAWFSAWARPGKTSKFTPSNLAWWLQARPEPVPNLKKHFTYPAQSSPTEAWASKLSGVAQTRNREQGILSSNNLHFVGAWFANKHTLTCDNSLHKRTTPWK